MLTTFTSSSEFMGVTLHKVATTLRQNDTGRRQPAAFGFKENQGQKHFILKHIFLFIQFPF